MGHDLYAHNKDLKPFRMGLAWLHLLEQCGSYFTYISKGARWYIYDERKSVIDKQYPAIICNCRFEITEEEAKVLARIAQNYAAIQRTVGEPSEEELNAPITTPDSLKPFPGKVRQDWIELFVHFAEWAEQSQGFKVH